MRGTKILNFKHRRKTRSYDKINVALRELESTEKIRPISTQNHISIVKYTTNAFEL